MSNSSKDLSALYRSLPVGSDKDKIRLLELHSGLPHTALKVTLKLTSLSENPHYEALSYTWGERTRDRSLLVNGRFRLAVTDNLDDALHSLRMLTRKQTMWVDAVCINQSDDSERGHQVAIMGQIFKTAKCVNVWLGRPSRWMMPISLRPSDIAMILRLFRASLTLKDRVANAAVRGVVLDFPDKLNSAVDNTRPKWHDRVWTMQEFLMAREVYLCFGRQKWLYRRGLFGKLAPSDRLWHKIPFWLSNRIDSIEHVRQAMLESNGHIDICESMRLISHATTSDVRDLLYGLSAFFGEEELRLLDVNYRSPVEVVFARATYASISYRNNFDMFMLNSLERPTHIEHLPSWAVDFTAVRTFPGMFLGDLQAIRRTTGQTKMDRFVQSDDSFKTVTISGISCGTVASIYDSQPIKDPTIMKGLIVELMEEATNSAHEIRSCGIPKASEWILERFHAKRGYDDSGNCVCKTLVQNIYVQNTSISDVLDDQWISVKYHFTNTLLGLLLDLHAAGSELQRNWTFGDTCIFSTNHGVVGIMINPTTQHDLQSGDQLIAVEDKHRCLILRCVDENYKLLGIACIEQQVHEDLWGSLMEAGFENEVQKFTLC